MNIELKPLASVCKGPSEYGNSFRNANKQVGWKECGASERAGIETTIEASQAIALKLHYQNVMEAKAWPPYPILWTKLIQRLHFNLIFPEKFSFYTYFSLEHVHIYYRR